MFIHFFHLSITGEVFYSLFLHVCQKLPSHHFLITITLMKVLIVVMLMQTEFAGFYELIVHFTLLLFLLLEIIRRAV